MNPRYDTDPGDDNDDFEATHRDLEAYVRGGQATSAGLERLRWERKMMRRIKSIESRLEKIEDKTHDTGEIAIIAQTEIKPTKEFVDAIRKWRSTIINSLIAAGATGAVAWFLSTHGVKQ